jgi:hypothetical protein
MALLGAGLAPGQAAPPSDRLAALQRGVNLTNWFRYPARQDDAALRSYLSDAAMAGLRAAGFTFVRLAVQPELVQAAPHRLALLVEAITRLQRHGLAVVLAPFPTTWHLEDNLTDQDRLLAFWRTTAPALRTLDPRLTYPELLNEPVFAGSPQAWDALQHAGLAVIRTALPGATVVLTGADWGGIDGLAALTPVADPNVIYSFHFYEPAELTALAAYRPGLDRAALARLPFPMDPSSCVPAEQASTDTVHARVDRIHLRSALGREPYRGPHRARCRLGHRTSRICVAWRIRRQSSAQRRGAFGLDQCRATGL